MKILKNFEVQLDAPWDLYSESAWFFHRWKYRARDNTVVAGLRLFGISIRSTKPT